ncbi:lamin tail domain-containing protein [Akkermansiaceae bacterium]|nr:lamin tail domain-containing protein [Akkermansiaceae bacterium]
MSFFRKGRLPSTGLAAVLCFCQFQEAFAEVVINEIGVAGSDRLLRSHPDGRPRLGWGASWCEFEFDDSDWTTGVSPFGYGTDGIATDLEDQMLGRTPSVYLRKIFTVSADDAARAEPFNLTAQADSGFVAFINGHEIARANLGRPNSFVFHVQSTFSSAESDETLNYDSVVLASDVLRPGENVFAVQVQNTVPSQINERDTTLDQSLKFEASLAVGLPDNESSTPIELTNEDWKYRLGHAEPSGGVVDWVHATHPDVEGGFSDWIELYNNGADEVALADWHLTDDQDLPDQWTFPDNTTIPAGGYLLVLADGSTEVPGDYLHASFALSSNGEFLGLSNASGAFVSQFDDGFPKQYPFQSYGLSAGGDGNYTFFESPSPGVANTGVELLGAVKKPNFAPAGGVYDETVELTITSTTDDAVIRYTVDGSEPSEVNGTVYERPISIESIDDRTGTPVRARAFKEGMITSADGTQTYLVGVDDVFKTIPTVSLVADSGEAFFKPHGIMSIEGRNVPRNVLEYYMPAMHGRSFERKISMEVIYPDDGTNVQIEGGLRISASQFSRGNFFLRRTDESPWESRPADKPSFNLFFRNDYGDDTLNFPLVENYPVRRFRQFRLRAGKNDITNPFVIDELVRRVFTDTGQLGSVGIQNALFVNGSYKGYYNTVARLREELFQDLNGSNQPWQVKHIDVWADGSPFDDALKDTPEWDHLEELLGKDLRILENYEAVIEELDPINFADYFIVNLYGATEDWPQNNLVIARELSESGRWRAYIWDAEVSFGVQSSHSLTYDSILTDLRNLSAAPSNDLATVWRGLSRSPEWRLLFADRLQRHFFTPGGALTKENLTRRLEELADEIAPLLAFAGLAIDTSEVAEWIEGREDVLFTPRRHWERYKLWGEAEVPVFSPSGGAVEAGTTVKISVDTPDEGSFIHYTTDGSDPRLPGGTPNPDAILVDLEADTDVVIDTTTTIKSRVQIKTPDDSTWGALRESTFRVDFEPAGSGNFLISELMIDPEGPNETEKAAGFSSANFEYIEFYNPSDVTIDLAHLRYTTGIDYIFGEGDITTLGPKAYGVIVNDRAAFTLRYDEGLPILGDYSKKLSNSGEQLEISNGRFEPIVSVSYSNEAPWPSNLNDEGNSLVFANLVAGTDPNDPANWKSSTVKGGTPGRAAGAGPLSSGAYDVWKAAQFTVAELTDEAISGLAADPDRDGDSNLVEFAFVTNPKDASSSVAIEAEVRALNIDGNLGDYLTLTLTQRTGAAVRYTLERTSNLQTWQLVPGVDLVEIDSQPGGKELRTVTYRTSSTEGVSQSYVRWRVELTKP